VNDYSADLKNPQLQGWINNPPPGAKAEVYDPFIPEGSTDTVYFEVKITLATRQIQGTSQYEIPIYWVEVHYHPVPTTKNFLHVKMRAGTSPKNVVQPGNWLIPNGNLLSGKALWNQTFPKNPATKP
jgi:hypothetical protein